MSEETGTILIVDDDPDFRASAGAVLESKGHQVLNAGSAAEGLDMLLQHRPDLVVLDIMMENSSAGYEVNHAIKHKPEYSDVSETPILMVSSVPASPSKLFGSGREASMITPDDYLTKPLDISEFLETVRFFLSRS